jgi:glycosyltransferase involved in cell wall biosynthesis
MKFVSIIIPAYNAERYLAQTVCSVIDQSFTNWELIIVNDGSADSTLQVARHFSEKDGRVRVITQENRGLAKARNRGFSESSDKSSHFLFLDADDVLEANTLERLLSGFQLQEKPAFVFGRVVLIDSNDTEIAPENLPKTFQGRWDLRNGNHVSVPLDNPITFDMLMASNPIWTAGSALISRASIEAVGLFDPLPKGVEDWDLWIRMSLYGPIRYLDERVLKYRYHPDSMSRNETLMDVGRMIMYRLRLGDAKLTDQQRLRALECIDFVYQSDYPIPIVLNGQRLLEEVIRRARIASIIPKADLSARECGLRDISVLRALEYNGELTEKLLAFEDAGECVVFTSIEMQKLRKGLKRLINEEVHLRSKQAANHMAIGKPSLAVRDWYHALRGRARAARL